MIALGATVRERTCGFQGTVIGRTEWMNGCVRYGVRSEKTEAGKPVDEWFDEPDLEVVEAKPEKEKRPTGGSRPAPARAADCPAR